MYLIENLDLSVSPSERKSDEWMGTDLSQQDINWGEKRKIKQVTQACVSAITGIYL